MVHKLAQGIFFILHRPVGRLVEYGILISVVVSGLGATIFYIKQYMRTKHLHLPFHLIDAKDVYTIRDLILTEYDSVHEDTPLKQIIELVKNSPTIDFPVVDNGGHLLGLVRFNDFRTILLQSHLYSKVSARDVMNPDVEVLRLNDSLEDAMMKFGKQDSDLLPVVDANDSSHILGIVKRSDLMKRYRKPLGEKVAK